MMCGNGIGHTGKKEWLSVATAAGAVKKIIITIIISGSSSNILITKHPDQIRMFREITVVMVSVLALLILLLTVGGCGGDKEIKPTCT